MGEKTGNRARLIPTFSSESSLVLEVLGVRETEVRKDLELNCKSKANKRTSVLIDGPLAALVSSPRFARRLLT